MRFQSASARALLSHANKRIAEFKELERSFNSSRPFTQFIDIDPVTDEKIFKAKVTGFEPLKFAPTTFDVLHALRSSLDHVVFDASAKLGSDPVPRNTKFPFGKTDADVRGDLNRKKANVPNDLAEHLLSYEPYRGGNSELWGLNDLRNQKIHRTLGVYAMASQSIGFGVRRGGYAHIQKLGPATSLSKWDSEKKELVYMRAAEADMTNVSIKVEVSVTFDDSPVFQGKSVAEVMDQLSSECKRIIYDTEKKTARLLRAK